MDYEIPNPPETNSDYPKIKEFTPSECPDFLLDGASARERHLTIATHKMSEFINWAAPAIIDTNSQVRRTNGRVKVLENHTNNCPIKQSVAQKVEELEKFRDKVVNKWSIIAGASTLILVPFLVSNAGKILDVLAKIF